MPLTQTFIIDNQFLGTASRTPDSEGRLPHSSMFFCGKCGKVYGFCPVTDGSGETIPFDAWRGCCSACPSDFIFTIPGSIWQGWDRGYTNSLPGPVLLREFNLIINNQQLLNAVE